jgi:hypothetical protein
VEKAITIYFVVERHAYSGDQIKKNEMGEACSTYWGRRGLYKVLVGKPEGKGPLERPRRRWEDNIKMDLQEVEWRYGLD